MAATKVEDRLRQALAADERPNELIDVVLRFELPKVAGRHPKQALKERREGVARAMSLCIEAALARAGELAGEEPAQVSMFPLLGSVMVQAHRPYLKALLDQADVVGAMLNSTANQRGVGQR
jgi:hypothetical protein